MAWKKKTSFYEFMQLYPHQDETRKALAYDMKIAAEEYPELKSIDSLSEMMISLTRLIKDPDSASAITGNLWCEYCFLCDHPF